MRAFSLRSLPYCMLIAILIWSSHVDISSARRGKHWRQNKASLASLYKKKTKNHGNTNHNHNSSKSKHKNAPPPPPPLQPPAPTPCPSLVPTPPPAPTPPPINASSPPPPPPPPPPPVPVPTPSPPVPTPQPAPTLPPPSEPKNKVPPPPPSPPFAPFHPPPLPAPTPPPSPFVKPPPPPNKGNDIVYNVLDFGAKGDGSSDDTKAFQAAWASACKVEASTMLVPSQYTFLVGPISFSGPYCQANIVFQLDGTIIAPTGSKPWGTGLLQWLEFTKLKGISVQGTGIIDGRGSVWWQKSMYDDSFNSESKLAVPLNSTNDETPPIPIRDSLGGRMPGIKPTALRFYGSFNVTVTGITIQNSPQCHLKFDFCSGVFVYNINISSPGDSPNTDGIHLQMSKDVLIRSSNLSCGDDCISIQTGCSNVFVRNVNCGPGHGISIGGLGKEGTRACVANVTVRDVAMHNTTNGVRIKTWQGGSGSVQNVLFSNIQVTEVQFPIVIDQYYCDKSTCKNQTSAVALSGITYEKVRGTYTIKPVHLACSDSLPCVDVTLTDIELKPQQEKYHMYDPFCWETYGELNSPTQPAIDCIQSGKPSRNRIQSDENLC